MVDIVQDTAEHENDTEFWFDLPGLLGRCLGNVELAYRVLERFRGNLNDNLRQLDLLAQQEDWEQFSTWIHRMNGEAANVGCIPLVQLASRIHEACTHGLPETVNSLLQELKCSSAIYLQQDLSITQMVDECAKYDQSPARHKLNSKYRTP